ncbi:MAG: hypothetical protein ABR936_14750 [Bacteroidota bacterium]|jgi:predicted  nucleic acid-binding Zn-ribbon protein
MKTFLPISPQLEAKLKDADSEIQAFVDALQLELMKLQKKNINLEANNVSLDARINVLQQELDKRKVFDDVVINVTNEELKEHSESLKKLEKSIHDSKSPDKVK